MNKLVYMFPLLLVACESTPDNTFTYSARDDKGKTKEIEIGVYNTLGKSRDPAYCASIGASHKDLGETSAAIINDEFSLLADLDTKDGPYEVQVSEKGVGKCTKLSPVSITSDDQKKYIAMVDKAFADLRAFGAMADGLRRVGEDLGAMSANPDPINVDKEMGIEPYKQDDFVAPAPVSAAEDRSMKSYEIMGDNVSKEECREIGARYDNPKNIGAIVDGKIEQVTFPGGYKLAVFPDGTCVNIEELL